LEEEDARKSAKDLEVYCQRDKVVTLMDSCSVKKKNDEANSSRELSRRSSENFKISFILKQSCRISNFLHRLANSTDCPSYCAIG